MSRHRTSLLVGRVAAGLAVLALPVLVGCTHTIRVINTGEADIEIREQDNPDGWVYTLGPGGSMRVKVAPGEEIDLPGVRLRVE